MAVCPDSDYSRLGECGGEVLDINREQWWCYYDDFRAGIEAAVPTITLTDNTITTFTPTNLLRRVDPNAEFSTAPTSTSAITAGGSRKFTQSIICQLQGSSAEKDKAKSDLTKKPIVVFFGIDGSGTPADKYKAFGVERGLSLADGGYVENVKDIDGTAVATFTGTPEKSQFENYNRYTLKTGTDAATEKAALDAAVIV